MEIFQSQLKSISLLPISDHGYVQAPYIEITEEEYKRLKANLTPLNLDVSRHEAEDKFCDGEACEITY